MSTVIPDLFPLNDLALSVQLKSVDPTSGALSYITTGSVTGFLATSDLPTATAADASLVATCNYSGANGKWTVTIDAALLTAALLNTLFATTTPYLIVQQTNDFRFAIQLAYSASRDIAVTA